MKTCPKCNHKFTPDVMDYDVIDIDTVNQTANVAITCPRCYDPVELLEINLMDFRPIR